MAIAAGVATIPIKLSAFVVAFEHCDMVAAILPIPKHSQSMKNSILYIASSTETFCQP